MCMCSMMYMYMYQIIQSIRVSGASCEARRCDYTRVNRWHLEHRKQLRVERDYAGKLRKINTSHGDVFSFETMMTEYRKMHHIVNVCIHKHATAMHEHGHEWSPIYEGTPKRSASCHTRIAPLREARSTADTS